MKFMKLDPEEREIYLSTLSDMPGYIEESFSGLSQENLCKSGSEGEFSPIEQIWHLADLEEEGFFLRINALLNGKAQKLSGFDGDKIAEERNYKSLSFTEGLEKFKRVRERNINIFQRLNESDWMKEGFMEDVGKISLCDMPSFLFQHDSAHKTEIENWKKANA